MNLLRLLINRLTGASDPGKRRVRHILTRQSGVRVDHDTALTYSAYWAAVRIISENIAAMPWHVFQRSVAVDGKISTIAMPGNPIDYLISTEPNEEIDSFTWRQVMVAWGLTWGNGYSEIDRSLSGIPGAMLQVEPDRVNPDRTKRGKLVYDINNFNSANTVLDANNVFHLKGMGYDGLVGYSVVAYAARTLGLSIAAEQFGSSFFENDTTVGVVLKHPQAIGSEAMKNVRESWMAKFAGVKKAHTPLVLEEGMSVERLGMPAKDAQLIETRQFNVVDVSRFTGVPPHKLAALERATFSNIEHQSIEFVVDALLSWVRRFEMEANRKLVRPSQRGKVVTRMNMKGLLRGDLTARAAWYKEMSALGVFSVNEIRELEDMNPIGAEGDKRLVQLNLTTLEKVGEEPPAPAQQNSPSPSMMVVKDALDRALNRETSAIGSAIKRYTKSGAKRDQFIAWMDRFYNEHARNMKTLLSVPVKACYESVSAKNDIGKTISTYVEKYIDQARINTLARFDDPGFDGGVVDTLEQTQILLGGIGL